MRRNEHILRTPFGSQVPPFVFERTFFRRAKATLRLCSTEIRRLHRSQDTILNSGALGSGGHPLRTASAVSESGPGLVREKRLLFPRSADAHVNKCVQYGVPEPHQTLRGGRPKRREPEPDSRRSGVRRLLAAFNSRCCRFNLMKTRFNQHRDSKAATCRRAPKRSPRRLTPRDSLPIGATTTSITTTTKAREPTEGWRGHFLQGGSRRLCSLSLVG